MNANTRERPVRGRRFLPDDVAGTFVSCAVGPRFGYPLCDELAASHAAGASTGCLVARAMRANIAFIQDQVDVCCGELLREEDFTAEKLAVHANNVSVLNTLIFFVTADRAFFSADRQNVVAKAFGALPQDVLLPYNEGILKIRDLLEDEILWPMFRLMDRIEGAEGSGQEGCNEDQIGSQGSPDWEEEIRSLLVERAPVRLAEIYRRLGDMALYIQGIAESIKADWECNINQIFGVGGCSGNGQVGKKE